MSSRLSFFFQLISKARVEDRKVAVRLFVHVAMDPNCQAEDATAGQAVQCPHGYLSALYGQPEWRTVVADASRNYLFRTALRALELIRGAGEIEKGEEKRKPFVTSPE